MFDFGVPLAKKGGVVMVPRLGTKAFGRKGTIRVPYKEVVCYIASEISKVIQEDTLYQLP